MIYVLLKKINITSRCTCTVDMGSDLPDRLSMGRLVLGYSPRCKLSDDEHVHIFEKVSARGVETPSLKRLLFTGSSGYHTLETTKLDFFFSSLGFRAPAKMRQNRLVIISFSSIQRAQKTYQSMTKKM